MKTKLAQISIPPLCTHTTEMAHTLVGKAVPLQVGGHGFKPQWGYGGKLWTLGVSHMHHGGMFVFVFFVF